MSSPLSERGGVHQPAELAEQFDSQHIIEIEANWEEEVKPFRYLYPQDWAKMAQLSSSTDTSPQRPYFFDGDEDTKTLTIRFTDQAAGRWARFYLVLHPMNDGIALQPWGGLLPTRHRSAPHIPYGIHVDITGTPEGDWSFDNPMFAILAEPEALSPQFLTDYDGKADGRIKDITFMMNFGQHQYIWRPDRAGVETLEDKITLIKPLNEEDDHAVRVGDQSMHKTNYFLLPVDTRLFDVSLTIASPTALRP